MGIVVTNAGEEAFLDLITAVNYTVKLYTNDTSSLTDAQKEALTTASFTEATFAGYADADLTGGSWTTTADDPSIASYAAQTFERSSTGTAQIVRGYYVVTTTGSTLRWFEEFETPITIENESDQIIITPRMSLEDGEEPSVARGIVAEFTSTSSDSARAAGATTDMVINDFVTDGTRKYKVWGYSLITLNGGSTAVNSNIDVAFYVDGNNTAEFWFEDNYAAVSTQNSLAASHFLWEPSAGTYDLSIRVVTIAAGPATITLTGSSSRPRGLFIEDVGAQ